MDLVKKLWSLNEHLLYKNEHKLLEFDQLNEDDIKCIWVDVSLSNHMLTKFVEDKYDPALFYSAACDCSNQYLLYNYFGFNITYIELTQLMNFFFWIKRSVGLHHLDEYFNDEEINNYWKAWKKSWSHKNGMKTIEFFFTLDNRVQRRLITEYQDMNKRLICVDKVL